MSGGPERAEAGADWWQEFFTSGSYTLLDEFPLEEAEAQVAFAARALETEGCADSGPVLDVACGVGRHSAPLAARGVPVVGLDYSAAYLRRAVERAGDGPARFVRGDMRRLPFRDAAFPAAVCLYNSFGYFSESDDARTLREVGRVLRPGGLLLLDIQHRDGVARSFQRRSWTRLRDGYLLEDREWDACSGRIVNRLTFLRGGEERAWTVSMRVYTMPEVARMLAAAGMEVLDVWGDWYGNPLALDSWAMIVKARRSLETTNDTNGHE